MNDAFESSHWISFDGQIEIMIWGEKVYTVLKIPEDVLRTTDQFSSKRVDLEIRDFSYNLALTRAPIFDGVFLYFGKDKLNETNLSVGDIAEFRLRASDPNIVEIPAELQAALILNDAEKLWNELSPGTRRTKLQPILKAKQQTTKGRRIHALIQSLRKPV
jgi:hypothetical protein